MEMVNKFFENLERIVGWMNNVFVFLASAMMIGLVVIVCSDNFLRYFLNSPLVWGTEVTELLLLYITFLGTAWVFREDGHVVIDVFTHQLDKRKRKILTLSVISCCYRRLGTHLLWIFCYLFLL
jgi:TRAP-type C4-dicarboxylate transport system permease small subunit